MAGYKFQYTSSAQSYLANLKECSDSFFTFIREAYVVFTIGKFFYAYYKPDWQWGRKILENPQVFGYAKDEADGTCTINCRNYYGLKLHTILILILFYILCVLAATHESGITNKELWYVILFSLVVVFALSINSFLFTKYSTFGQDSAQALDSFILNAGRRYL